MPAPLPLDIGAYVADTIHLTPREHGVYLLMLMWCWRHERPIPNDRGRISGIANAFDEADEQAAHSVLAEFFTLGDDNCYHNKRMEAELHRVHKRQRGNDDLPACPHLAVLALWAEVLPAMPQHDPTMWTGLRADQLKTRWRETAAAKGWRTAADGLLYFRKLFAYIARSPFFMGKVPPRDGHKQFTIELQWLVRPTNWANTIEGKYHEERT